VRDIRQHEPLCSLDHRTSSLSILRPCRRTQRNSALTNNAPFTALYTAVAGNWFSRSVASNNWGMQRIEDPHHSRGYRELRSNTEIRRLDNRKIVEQNKTCGICHDLFTSYNDIVPDDINPKGMGGAWRDDHLTISEPFTGGATERKDRAGSRLQCIRGDRTR
jgi:hypothetical protein